MSGTGFICCSLNTRYLGRYRMNSTCPIWLLVPMLRVAAIYCVRPIPSPHAHIGTQEEAPASHNHHTLFIEHHTSSVLITTSTATFTPPASFVRPNP